MIEFYKLLSDMQKSCSKPNLQKTYRTEENTVKEKERTTKEVEVKMKLTVPP